ncbi:hypothetical protein N646_1488 [Vibrio alginolyticus NBRC 15630 = ATCC 17749]|uniref:Uncharacterized protein n=1 Tax=Vibrio alginolyticus (strain ATCC 17749 / DSM 2171 / NBRC 15630 / NCIMB 1903 / NCTC 12160 / XII-53) TaxID=1219076 RepID=A0A2I3C8U0_VIBAX|nr:hypothetical protein N646_1488 [Vibrio alginolyticus NBRC 15630 = ATCC 17749]
MDLLLRESEHGVPNLGLRIQNASVNDVEFVYKSNAKILDLR